MAKAAWMVFQAAFVVRPLFVAHVEVRSRQGICR